MPAVHCPALLTRSCCCFPRTGVFFTPPFSAMGTHSNSVRCSKEKKLVTQPYQHEKCTPTFLETIFQTEKKQVALSQLVTLSPSLPPSFIWKSKGLAAKYISPSFQSGSVRETWQETAFDKNPSLSTSERALSFISTPLPVHKHRASGVSAGGTAFLSGSYNSEAAPIIFFCHL